MSMYTSLSDIVLKCLIDLQVFKICHTSADTENSEKFNSLFFQVWRLSFAAFMRTSRLQQGCYLRRCCAFLETCWTRLSRGWPGTKSSETPIKISGALEQLSTDVVSHRHTLTSSLAFDTKCFTTKFLLRRGHSVAH